MTKEEAAEVFLFMQKVSKILEQEPKTEGARGDIPIQPTVPEMPKTDGDCISRAELLKAIDTWDKFGFEHTGCFVREPKDDFITYVHYDDVIKCIKGMPSVNPQEPKTDNRVKTELNRVKTELEPKTDVLDKIRTEIAEFEERIAELPNMSAAYATVWHCLNIIDKYKAESEVQE